MIDGSKSLGRPEFIAGKGSLVMSLFDKWIGGNSIEDRGILRPSESECQPCCSLSTASLAQSTCQLLTPSESHSWSVLWPWS